MKNKPTTNIDNTQKNNDPVVTRSYLDKRFDDFEKRMDKKIGKLGIEIASVEIRMRLEFEDLKQEIEDKASERHNQLFDLVDGLAGEVQDGRDFRKISSYRQAQHSDRIEKLEKKVFGRVQSV